MKAFAVVLCLCLLGLVASPARADVPNSISLQGRLTDAGGTVLSDGNYSIRFRVYTDSLAGIVLWESTNNVPVSGGVFSTALDIPDSVFNDPNRWLGISVDLNPEMSPRPRLTSVGYAHRSGQWTSLGNNVYRTVGHLGLGTPTPLRRLHVYDSLGTPQVARFEGNSTVASVVEFSNTSSGALWQLGINGTIGPVPPGGMYIQRAGSQGIPFTIDVNDRVGIGAAAPIRNFHVYNPDPGDAFVARFEGSNQYATVAELTNTVNGVNWQLGIGGPLASVGDGSLFLGRIGLSDTPFKINTEGNVLVRSPVNVSIGSLLVEDGPNAVAIACYSDHVFGTCVEAHASGTSGWGIYAGGVEFAGVFSGNVEVSGTITKSAGSTKIDHPLDPSNKYLSHTGVESPDMKNIYDGIVVTDANGDATMTMPDWFEAVNRDFRYQLTVIGEFAQAIVSEEIAGNQFSIKTDKPNVKVSWQVTGVRQDPYANAHRAPVEELKPVEERGFYIHPELYDQPAEKEITWAKRPEMMRAVKERREKAEAAVPDE